MLAKSIIGYPLCFREGGKVPIGWSVLHSLSIYCPQVVVFKGQHTYTDKEVTVKQRNNKQYNYHPAGKMISFYILQNTL